jgi:hypothetical protein
MESKSRCPALVKLRSAEADPHVTKRACESAGEPTDPALALPTPEGANRGESIPAARVRCRAALAEARPLTSPPHTSIWSLQRRPLPDATVNTARVEQLTSGLCSADESVATHRRFQRCAARFSHGLGSPSRSPLLRVRPDLLRTEVLSCLGSRFPASKPAGPRHRSPRHGDS